MSGFSRLSKSFFVILIQMTVGTDVKVVTVVTVLTVLTKKVFFIHTTTTKKFPCFYIKKNPTTNFIFFLLIFTKKNLFNNKTFSQKKLFDQKKHFSQNTFFKKKKCLSQFVLLPQKKLFTPFFLLNPTIFFTQKL